MAGSGTYFKFNVPPPGGGGGEGVEVRSPNVEGREWSWKGGGEGKREISTGAILREMRLAGN